MVCIRNRGGPNGFGAIFVASLSSEEINAIFAKSISSVKSLDSVHILFAQGQQPLKRSRKFSHSTSFLGKHTQGTSYIINVNFGKSHPNDEHNLRLGAKFICACNKYFNTCKNEVTILFYLF